jgi:hypothetical protein
MAELPMRDRGAGGRLMRMRLLADLERAERERKAMRRRYIKHLDEQMAKIMGAPRRSLRRMKEIAVEELGA